MKLSSQAIKEFREIYFKVTVQNTNDEKLTEEALALLNYFELVYRPIPKAYLLENTNLVVSSEHTS